MKAKYKLAREQKPFGPAKIENKLKYMQTTNKYATRNKILLEKAPIPKPNMHKIGLNKGSK